MTHHAPSWEVLTAGGLVRLPVENWLRSITSKLSVVERSIFREWIGTDPARTGWAVTRRLLTRSCGTNAGTSSGCTATRMRTPILAIGQCRVVCNPRGYSRGAEYRNDPSSVGFDERFVVDTADGGVMPILNSHIDGAIETAESPAAHLKALRPHVNHRTPAIRESVRELARRYGDLVLESLEATANKIHDATGCDGFHLPGKVLHLPGVEWKARFPQLVYFPSPQPETADLAALRDEFPPDLSIFAEEPKDGGIGAILAEVRHFIRDLERVRTWRQQYPVGMRKVLKPVMALLDSVGADPEFVESRSN